MVFSLLTIVNNEPGNQIRISCKVCASRRRNWSTIVMNEWPYYPPIYKMTFEDPLLTVTENNLVKYEIFSVIPVLTADTL